MVFVRFWKTEQKIWGVEYSSPLATDPTHMVPDLQNILRFVMATMEEV